LLACTVSHLGRQEEAERLAARVEQLAVRVLGPEHELSVPWLMATIAQRQGDLARAEDLLRRSLDARERTSGRLHHSTVQTLKDLAYVVRERGRTDEARRLYVETIDRMSHVYGLSHIYVSAQLGLLLETLRSDRDYAAIRDHWERWLRALLATPVEADPYQRDRRLVRLGSLIRPLVSLPESIPLDAELIIRAAEEAHALKPTWDGTLAEIYARLGRFDLAARNLAEGVRRCADDPRALNNIAWCLATFPVPQLRDPARAVEMARKAVEKAPQSSSYWNTLGVARYRARDWKGAIEALEKSESLEPEKNLPFNGFFLAMAKWQLGQKGNARIWFDKAAAGMEKNRSTDDPHRFRAEAGALLDLDHSEREAKTAGEPTPTPK
jgi:Flp pilus assembly protein TadD